MSRYTNNVKNQDIQDFWKEFNRRGFSTCNRQGGHYYKGLIMYNGFKVHYEGQPDINIVSKKCFIDTINRLESIVKYQLFK